MMHDVLANFKFQIKEFTMMSILFLEALSEKRLLVQKSILALAHAMKT